MIMYQSIKTLPQQFSVGYQLGRNLKFAAQGITRINLSGLGGSSLPGDLLNDYLRASCFIHLHRDYDLPADLSSRDLVFCASYSGNTEETLSSLEEARKRKAHIIILSHGGQLKRKAADLSLPFIEIPESVQPRQAVGYFFSAILGVLEELKLTPPQQEVLKDLESFLQSVNSVCEQKGKDLAVSLVDKVPIIYGPTILQGVCRIWKIKMNENVKIPAFFNVFPEMNHNEMVGWTRLNFHAAFVYLISQYMHPRIFKRMQVMKEILSEKIPIHEIKLTGANLLQEMFEALLIGDYTTYYMAINAGVDPAPVEMVEAFKKKLD